MLFLLRQLRRSFFQPGKLRTYVAYALGEILLIVIGILIALQIQNWNQQRLDRIEEGYLLIELIDNLNQEVERLEVGTERLREQNESFYQIRSFLKSDGTSEDEFQKNMADFSGNFAFNPITSAYETMKSTGLGFSNRELKRMLVQYYDVNQPLLLRTLDSQREFNRSHIQPIIINYMPEGGYTEGRRVPKDVDDPEFREAVLGVIGSLIGRSNLAIERCENIYQMNREILTTVKEELERI